MDFCLVSKPDGEADIPKDRQPGNRASQDAVLGFTFSQILRLLIKN
jgi:hypothetical protein